MADVTTSKNVLQMVAEFKDEDTRTITVEDPNTAINLAAAVNDIGDYVAQNKILLGDKDGSEFARIRSAKIVRSSSTKFDLG